MSNTLFTTTRAKRWYIGKLRTELKQFGSNTLFRTTRAKRWFIGKLRTELKQFGSNTLLKTTTAKGWFIGKLRIDVNQCSHISLLSGQLFGCEPSAGSRLVRFKMCLHKPSRQTFEVYISR